MVTTMMVTYPQGQRCSIRGSFMERSSQPCFTKKIPQTSVAPTFKLTLPSDFVTTHVAHLIDQDFDLVDEEERTWEVSILPRKNKDKHEYTLHGWKAFAVEHNVQPTDRLQFEVTLDPNRVRATIIRKGAHRERFSYIQPSNNANNALALALSPPLPLMTHTHRTFSSPDYGSGGGRDYTHDDNSPASVRTAPPLHTHAHSELGYSDRANSGPLGYMSGGAKPGRAGGFTPYHLTSGGTSGGMYGGFGGASTASGLASGPGGHHASSAGPGGPSGRGGGLGSRGVDSGDGGASAQTRQLPALEGVGDAGGGPSGAAGSGDTISDDNAWGHGPMSGAGWHSPGATPRNQFGGMKKRKGSGLDYNLGRLSPGLKRAKESSNSKQLLDGVEFNVGEGNGGMHLLSSVAQRELAMSGSHDEGTPHPDTPPTFHSSPDSQNGAEQAAAISRQMQNAFQATEALLDQTTNRGLHSAKTICGLAESLIQSLNGPCSPQVQQHVLQIRQELLDHAEVVLGVMYSVRQLPKTWHHWALPCVSTMS